MFILTGDHNIIASLMEYKLHQLCLPIRHNRLRLRWLYIHCKNRCFFFFNEALVTDIVASQATLVLLLS